MSPFRAATNISGEAETQAKAKRSREGVNTLQKRT